MPHAAQHEAPQRPHGQRANRFLVSWVFPAVATVVCWVNWRAALKRARLCVCSENAEAARVRFAVDQTAPNSLHLSLAPLTSPSLTRLLSRLLSSDGLHKSWLILALSRSRLIH
jgi:hypothetical protein